MPETPISDLKDTLPRGKRLLGLDLGSKTIGLAISDGALQLSTPLDTIRRKKFTPDAEALFRIVDERDVLITKNTQTGKLKTTISPQRNKHKQNPHRSGQSSFAASALLSNSAQ